MTANYSIKAFDHDFTQLKAGSQIRATLQQREVAVYSFEAKAGTSYDVGIRAPPGRVFVSIKEGATLLSKSMDSIQDVRAKDNASWSIQVSKWNDADLEEVQYSLFVAEVGLKRYLTMGELTESIIRANSTTQFYIVTDPSNELMLQIQGYTASPNISFKLGYEKSA